MSKYIDTTDDVVIQIGDVIIVFPRALQAEVAKGQFKEAIESLEIQLSVIDAMNKRKEVKNGDPNSSKN